MPPEPPPVPTLVGARHRVEDARRRLEEAREASRRVREGPAVVVAIEEVVPVVGSPVRASDGDNLPVAATVGEGVELTGAAAWREVLDLWRANRELLALGVFPPAAAELVDQSRGRSRPMLYPGPVHRH